MVNCGHVNLHGQVIGVYPNIPTSCFLPRPYKDFTVTTYFHHRYGVRPAEPVTPLEPPARRGFNGARGLSAMLLAAMVSALLVVADQLISAWADGHLMVAWVALWLVGFSAIALFADAANKLASTVMAALHAARTRRQG